MPQRNFRVIPPDRCLQLMQHEWIGRVGWAGADGIEILPVAYAVREPHIVFRTARYGLLSCLWEPRRVTFEVDRFDLDSRSGWSVVARGDTGPVEPADELAELLGGTDPMPWAPGERNLIIAITVDRVTGRIVGGV